jgi:thymidylate kinase
MEHYLGFDESSGKLFHLHVHYQLVLGEEYIKNFRLPLEQAFLNHTRMIKGIWTPIPELEIIILSIRIMLKYRFRDAVKDILSIRSPGIKKAFLDEIDWLMNQTNLERIKSTLTDITPILPAEIILEFLKTLEKGSRDGAKLVSLQRKLRKALSAYQRRSLFSATVSYFQQLWTRRKSFLRTSPSSGLKLPQGGLTIAMLGADGAGKSTLSTEISKWLSWKLDVRNFYLGSKQPSWMSRSLYYAFRIFRRSHSIASKIFSDRNFVSRVLLEIRDDFLYLHHLINGRDRYQRYEQGARLATEGCVVIFDRFPVSTFDQATNYHLLDGPRIQALTADQETNIARRFSKSEQSLYDQFEAPDALVFLHVSPEISIRRKPDHQEALIRIKSESITRIAQRAEWEYGSKRCIQIDANLPYDQVLSQLKQEIWKLL